MSYVQESEFDFMSVGKSSLSICDLLLERISEIGKEPFGNSSQDIDVGFFGIIIVAFLGIISVCGVD